MCLLCLYIFSDRDKRSITSLIKLLRNKGFQVWSIQLTVLVGRMGERVRALWCAKPGHAVARSPAREMLLSDCREVGAPVIATSPCKKHREHSPQKGGVHINAGKAFLSSWRSSIGRAWKFSIIEERPSVSHLINYYILFLPCSPLRPENKELCLNNTASVKLRCM